MPKIITVTANTALDLYIEVEGLALRDNILAHSSTEFACGKGVNVAKGVASLATPVSCLGFVGRQSLQAFKGLDYPYLQTDFTAVEGKTRTNITLLDLAANQETHIRTAGFCISADDCRKLGAQLAALVETADIVVLSGSLPEGAAAGFYRDMIELCRRKGAKVMLDSSANALLTGLSAKPCCIKPNQQELEEIIGAALPDEPAIVAAARRIVRQGIDWVYVSRGAQGVIVVGRRVALAANVANPPVNVISHIGCGDAMVAGLAVATLAGKNLEETVKTAVACGVANLYCLEPGKFDRRLQAEIMTQIHIRSL